MISSFLVSTRGFIILGLPVAILIALIWSWRRRDGWWRATVRLALGVYLIVLIDVLFFPFPLPPWHSPGFDPFAGATWPQPWANIVPFATIRDAIELGPDWPQFQLLIGNIVAFVPLGILVGCLWPQSHSWRRAISIGLAVSVGVELSQLGLSSLMGYAYRVADVDDVILNTTDVVLGYGVFRAADSIGRALLPTRFIFWT